MMRRVLALVLVAALVGGFFMPIFTHQAVAAELEWTHSNGTQEEKPNVSVQIVTVMPLGPNEILVILLVTKGDGEILVTLWTWPGGRELAVSRL